MLWFNIDSNSYIYKEEEQSEMSFFVFLNKV